MISENHCSVEKTVDKVVTKLRQSGFRTKLYKFLKQKIHTDIS